MQSDEQVVPSNLDSEQALLGALLLNNGLYARVSRLVSDDDFYEPVHQKIFGLIVAALTQGRTATPITIKSYIEDTDLGGMRVSEYLARLVSNTSVSGHVEEYARTIRDLAVRRRLISIAEGVRSTAYTAGIDVPSVDIAREAMTAIHEAVSANGEVKQAASLGAIVKRVFQVTTDRLQGKATDVPSTGLVDLDKALGGGYRPGRLIVMAARPGAGKTVFLTSTARQSAAKGYGCLLFSLEIDEEEIGARILADASLDSAEGKVEYQRIMNGWINDHDASKIFELDRQVDRLPIRIDCSSSLTMAEIELRARMEMERMKRAGTELRVVGIDYLQLIKADQTYRGNKVLELGQIALHAKEMAKRLGVCVVMLCQISRGVEAREEKRPTLSDLRGSGEIEEVADVVGLLYREAYYIEKSPEYQRGDEGAISVYLSKQHDLEIILAKNRLGPVRTVNVWADLKFSAIRSAGLPV